MSLKRVRDFVTPHKSTPKKKSNTHVTPKKTTRIQRTLFSRSSMNDTPTPGGSRSETSDITKVNKTSIMDFSTFRDYFVRLINDEEVSVGFQNMMMPAIEPLISENTTNIAKLISTIEVQQVEIDALRNELEDVKQQSRNKTLVIQGLKPVKDETLDTTVMKMCKEKLQVNMHPVDIDSVTRLRITDKKAEYGNILLTVTTNRKKVDICRAKSKLKDQNERIYINESLTQQQDKLFAMMRAKVRNKELHATWTREGRIFVKEKADAKARVINKKDLEK